VRFWHFCFGITDRPLNDLTPCYYTSFLNVFCMNADAAPGYASVRFLVQCPPWIAIIALWKSNISSMP